ncbi:hypothetical protein MAR_028897, partial [Mya arenaria]
PRWSFFYSQHDARSIGYRKCDNVFTGNVTRDIAFKNKHCYYTVSSRCSQRSIYGPHCWDRGGLAPGGCGAYFRHRL